MKIKVYANSVLLLILTLGLTACVSSRANETTEGYRLLCESFRGASEATLLGYWGEPDKVRQGPRGKAFRYNSITKTVIPGSVTYLPQQAYHSGTIRGSGYGNASYSGASTINVPVRDPDQIKTSFCLTSFIIDNDGRVADFRFEGPDCVAKETSESVNQAR